MSGNCCFRLQDKPLFNEYLIAIISLSPSNVRCSLFSMIKKTFLSNSKSAPFWVKSGYLSKWSMITFKSFWEKTRNLTASLPCNEITPILLKNFWMRFSNAISFLCKPISKASLTLQPILLKKKKKKRDLLK